MPTAGLRRWWRELRRALLDLVLPPHCPACGVDGPDDLCPACRATLATRAAPACARCGEPLPVGQERCAQPHDWITGIRWARAPFRYAGTGGALVRRLKLDGDFRAGHRLARAMAASAAACVRDPHWRRAVLVPVPLHRARQRERGFNQADFLAEQLAVRLRLPPPMLALRRIAATLPQGDPRVASRLHNVAMAFAVGAPRLVAERRVILVDDVVTSGATARTCAAVLRAAGALDVALLTACRA